MFDQLWRLAQILKGKSKGAAEHEIEPMPLRYSLREPEPEEAVAFSPRPPLPSGPPPPPLPPGPPPVPAPLPAGAKGGPRKGDKGKGDEAGREEQCEKGGPKGDHGNLDDSTKGGPGKGKGGVLPVNPPKTPAEASRPKAKNMPPAAGMGKGVAGPSPRMPSGSWVQCWMWLPATGGSAIAPYLPADVASGCPPGADWGKGMGKSEEPDQATAVSWLHFFGFFGRHVFKHVQTNYPILKFARCKISRMSNLIICFKFQMMVR